MTEKTNNAAGGSGISTNWLSDADTFEKYVYVQILSNIAVNPWTDEVILDKTSRLAQKAKKKFFPKA